MHVHATLFGVLKGVLRHAEYPTDQRWWILTLHDDYKPVIQSPRRGRGIHLNIEITALFQGRKDGPHAPKKGLWVTFKGTHPDQFPHPSLLQPT